MRRTLRWACLFVLLAWSVSCTSTPVTIHLSTWTSGDEAAQLQKLIDHINAGNTEYQIIHQPLATDYYTQIQTQMANGTAADLLWMDQSHLSWAADGSFLLLKDCVANAAPKSAGDTNDYFPGILQIDYQNHMLYGLPWVAQPVVLYYNKNMFDAAKLAYPTARWTWDDFTNAAKALTKDTNGDGTADQWGTTATGWPPPQMFIWQAGGDVITPDLATSPIDSREALDGMSFYLSLDIDPTIAPGADVTRKQSFSDLFKAGKVAMVFASASDDLDYNSPGITVGVVPPPKNPKTGSNITYAWTASTVINAASKHSKESCDALLALSEAIDNWKLLSPRVSQATVAHLVASEPRKAANAQAFLDAAQNMSAFRIVPKYIEWEDTLWSQYFSPLLNQENDEAPSMIALARDVRPQLEELLPGATPTPAP
jgi:multiple sugar transport system substrate-binding protein